MRKFNRLHWRYCAIGLLSLTLSTGCDNPWSMTVEAKPGAPLRIVTNPNTATLVWAEECEGNHRIRVLLEQSAELDFADVEFDAALDFITSKYHVPLQPMNGVLTALGVDLKQIVSARHPASPLKVVLRSFLKRYELRYVVYDGVLWVTSIYDETNYFKTRIYPVEDLTVPAHDPSAPAEIRSLVDLISATIAPNTWQENGGLEGSIRPYEGNGVAAIAVAHRDEVLEDVEYLLANLRNARSKTLRDAQAQRSQFSPVPGGPVSAARMVGGGCVF